MTLESPCLGQRHCSSLMTHAVQDDLGGLHVQGETCEAVRSTGCSSSSKELGWGPFCPPASSQHGKNHQAVLRKPKQKPSAVSGTSMMLVSQSSPVRQREAANGYKWPGWA